MRVGFVGLGAMGRPMAVNILGGGHQLIAYDTNPAAVAALVSAGASVASDYRDLGAASDVVVTMLPTPADVESAVLGTNGLASGLARGTTFIDMSTGDPLTAQRLAQKLGPDGIDVIDCPVGRGQEQAAAGTLLLLAGGRDAAIERVRPVLMCMGDELIHCGEHGMGQAMKLVNNMLSLIILEGIAEAIALGLRTGLSLDLIKRVTGKTSAKTSLMDRGVPERALEDLTPGFALRLAHKDLALATALAERLDIAVPTAEVTLKCCAELMAAGHGDLDCGVLVATRASNWATGGGGGARPARGQAAGRHTG